jgi:hypothetical protein
MEQFDTVNTNRRTCLYIATCFPDCLVAFVKPATPGTQPTSSMLAMTRRTYGGYWLVSLILQSCGLGTQTSSMSLFIVHSSVYLFPTTLPARASYKRLDHFTSYPGCMVGASRLVCMLIWVASRGALILSSFLPFKRDRHLPSSLVRRHTRWTTHTGGSHAWRRELHTTRRGASRWALRRESRRKALWKRRHTWRHTFTRS